MRQMRQIAVLVAVFGMMASAAFAAKPGKVKGARAHGPADRLREVVSQLNLTDDQRPKVDQILSDLEGKLSEARSDAKSSGDKDAAKTKVREAIMDARTKIGEILTPDQKAKLKQLMAEERGEKKGERKGAASQPSKQE